MNEHFARPFWFKRRCNLLSPLNWSNLLTALWFIHQISSDSKRRSRIASSVYTVQLTNPCFYCVVHTKRKFTYYSAFRLNQQSWRLFIRSLWWHQFGWGKSSSSIDCDSEIKTFEYRIRRGDKTFCFSRLFIASLLKHGIFLDGNTSLIKMFGRLFPFLKT